MFKRILFKICTSMNLKELIDDPRYKTNKDRVQQRKPLLEILSKRYILFKNNLWCSFYPNVFRFKEETLSYWKENLRTTRFPSGLLLHHMYWFINLN